MIPNKEISMKHNPELKPDPLSRENLIVWLMLQPPDMEYNFDSLSQCMLGQWVRSIDANARQSMDGLYCYKVNGEIVNLRHFRVVAGGKSKQDWTFGAALKRARACS